MPGYTYGSNISYQSSNDTFAGTGQVQLRRRVSANLANRLNLPNAKVSVILTVTAGFWLRGAVPHAPGLPSSYDADAQDYFNRVAGNGGSIGDTTKAAVNQLVLDLKAQSLWTKMLRISPRVGNELAAALVPLKYSTGGVLDIATGYVAGDYTLAEGLTGARGLLFGTKSIDTGINLQTAYAANNDISFGLFVRNNVGATADDGMTADHQRFDIFAADGAGTISMETARFIGGTTSGGPAVQLYSPSTISFQGTQVANPAFMVAVGASSGSSPKREFMNGVVRSQASISASRPAVTVKTCRTLRKYGFEFWGSSLTDTEVSTLNTIVQNFEAFARSGSGGSSGGGGRTMKFTIPQNAQGIQGVHVNNGELSLTQRASIDEVTQNSGSFYYDHSNRLLYVTPPDPATRSFWDDTYQAKLLFYFTTGEHKRFRGVRFEGRLLEAPTLTLRIDSRFSGVGQIGSGSCVLDNKDSFFDLLDTSSFQWDAGKVVMEVGIDLPGGAGELAESDYQKVGTWRVETHARTDDKFTLQLREPKTALENKIPYRTYTRAEFPAIAEEHIGKPIPICWGRKNGIKPMLIDATAKKFKVADHEIRSLEGVRVKTETEKWKQINFASQDLRKAEFTLGDDWNGTDEVSVDLHGRTVADGSLMENCADIANDVLDIAGEKDLEAESFALARSWFHVGNDRYGDEVSVLAPAIYLDTARSVGDVLAEINNIAGSFIFIDHEGRYRYGVFQPARAKDLDPQAGNIIQSFGENDILQSPVPEKKTDNSKLFSKLVVRFNERPQEGWAETCEPEVPRNRHLHNLAPIFNEIKTVAMSKREDALYWGERFLTTEAEPLTKYTFAVPWKGVFLLPGDKVKTKLPRFKLNSVLEVYECRYNFNSPASVTLVCGNLRGWEDTFGFWSEEGSGEPPQSGLVSWLKPESHIYSEGQRIEIWRDASGENLHALGSTALGVPDPPGPILKLASLSANGHPVAYCGRNSNGEAYIGQSFTVPSTAIARLNASQSGEIFAVLKPDSITPAFDNGEPNVIWNLGAPSFFPHYSGGDIREGFGSSSAATGISAANIIDGWNLYNVSRATGNMTVRVNNVGVYNADPGGAVAFGFGIPASGPIGNGGFIDTWFAGAFAEVLVYDRVLSSQERSDVLQYLSDKYGLALVAALPPKEWNAAATDDEITEDRQNYGFWHGQDHNGKETDMANLTDSRSHLTGRWW